MSEKRFILSVNEDATATLDIIDIVADKTYNFVNDVVSMNQAIQLVDLLNEQQATINEYKENWDDLVELATKTSRRNVELDEQIGQLRKELNDCEKFRYTVFKRIGELNDE